MPLSPPDARASGDPDEQATLARASGLVGGSIPAFTLGEHVAGRYQLVRFIARGGMGEVYEAQDLELGGRLALKTIRTDAAAAPGAIERFRREIALGRKVGHPNVCRVFDIGRHERAGGDAIVFLTMELLDGESLSENLARAGPMTTLHALPLVKQMAAGLHAAHQKGIVHRDFKALNVMLVPGDGAARAVITDFGLARLAFATDSPQPAVTRHGEVLGSPPYMAPEQALGREVTTAADVYALGVVMYEMVTGHYPFEAGNPMETILKRLVGPAPSPLGHVPDLAEPWEAVILRCLEREPEGRYGSVLDVASALEAEVPARPRRSEAVRRSVAFLGFKNLTGRSEAAWLSVALSEMLGMEVAAGEQLRLIPGETVARAKLELELSEADGYGIGTLQRIRSNVGCDLVVLGSYVALGPRLRLDLKVQHAVSGDTVATLSELGTEEALFELVAKTGAALRERLGQGALSEEVASTIRAALPRSTDAARYYADGLDKLRRFERRAAESLLLRAVALDPESAMAHAALADAYAEQGYEGKALVAAGRAMALGKTLPREERLGIEAHYRELNGEMDRAIEIRRALLEFFPDSIEHGLSLARVQVLSGATSDARRTLDALRRLPEPELAKDPRIDGLQAWLALLQGEQEEAISACDRAIQEAAARRATLLVAHAVRAKGGALVTLGHLDLAIKCYEEAQDAFASSGDTAQVAEIGFRIERCRNAGGAELKAHLATAIASCREVGDLPIETRLLSELGWLQFSEGDVTNAERTFAEVVARGRIIGTRSTTLASGLIHHEVARRRQGHPQDNDGAIEEGLGLLRASGHKADLADALTNVGGMLASSGSFRSAIEHWREALAMYRAMGDRGNIASTLRILGGHLDIVGELEAARKMLEEALTWSRLSRIATQEAGVLEELGGLEISRDDLVAALRDLEMAAEVFSGTEQRRALPRIDMQIAFVLLEQEKAASCEDKIRDAISKLSLNWCGEQSWCRCILARALLLQGRCAEAKLAYHEGVGCMGSPPVHFRMMLEIEHLALGVLTHIGDGAGSSQAIASLDELRERALRAGAVQQALQARLAMGEVELASGKLEEGWSRLRDLERDAEQTGWRRIARKCRELLAAIR